MEEHLRELLQGAIDTLALAQARLANIMETMRTQNVDLGPDYTRLEEEMTRIVDSLTAMKHLAERLNGASG